MAKVVPTLTRIVNAYRDDNSYTPDMAYLQATYTHVPVFIYGTMKEGFSEHDRLRGTPRFATGVTVQSNYEMYRLDGDPLCFFRPNSDVRAIIQGEIYVVPVPVLFELDAYHQNGMFHTRLNRAVRFFEKEGKRRRQRITQCWFYQANPDAFKHRMSEASQITPFYPRKDKTKPPFYCFTSLYDKSNRDRQAARKG
jgi:gamma-glutamylcyclotransferase (GGCT)/AIG2-like uncharacterized protein YtfP